MIDSEPVVFVVDDDPAMRESVRWLIESVSLKAETYDSAQAFLAHFQPSQWGCLVLDVRMPGMGGLELQEKLAEQNSCLPIIIVTGHGDVPMAVRAMKTGAVDFIEKPFSDQGLLDRIQQAISLHRKLLEDAKQRADINKRIKLLSPREHDVMSMVVVGKSNKVIAAALGLSPKTIEVHRARVMEKMQVKSLPELVRLHVKVRDH
ncbi:MAG: response regulator transcription factor [Phycisphaerales bacterium]|nr:response regulator transcription factor [Phycisphaerales bacterium]